LHNISRETVAQETEATKNKHAMNAALQPKLIHILRNLEWKIDLLRRSGATSNDPALVVLNFAVCETIRVGDEVNQFLDERMATNKSYAIAPAATHLSKGYDHMFKSCLCSWKAMERMVKAREKAWPAVLSFPDSIYVCPG
jgi:hypothetical protein